MVICKQLILDFKLTFEIKGDAKTNGMLSTLTYAHSFLSVPAGRSTFGQTNSGPSSGNCGPKKSADAKFTPFTRGTPIVTEWPRNNHAGGFMRYSIAPFENSDTDGIFDDPQHVFHYECAEKGCKSGGEDPNGGDPSSTPHSNICKGDMTIPGWVPDGKYTIQAQWYGTGNSFGDKFRGQFNFVSCVDVTIAGGTAHQANEYTAALKSTTPQTQCKSGATFTPGDVTGTTGCKFFTATTGKVHGCQDNACKCAVTSGSDTSCYQRSAPPEFCGTATNGSTPATGTNTTSSDAATTGTSPNAATTGTMTDFLSTLPSTSPDTPADTSPVAAETPAPIGPASGGSKCKAKNY